jgi:peroxiredoxin
MNKKKCIRADDKALDFTVDDQNEKPFTLSTFEGKRVLLSFHPLAWTSVCAQQMKSLEKNTKVFEQLNTVAVGVSVDTVPSKKAWAKHLGIHKTRLLSDFWPHGHVASKYGIFRSADGISERANIIIDPQQTVEYIQIYELGELPDIKEIITVLQTNE